MEYPIHNNNCFIETNKKHLEDERAAVGENQQYKQNTNWSNGRKLDKRKVGNIEVNTEDIGASSNCMDFMNGQ